MNKIHRIKLEIESDREYRNIDIDLDILFNKIKRIDKAIEYIEKTTNNGMFELRSDNGELDKLLDILKGSHSNE